jgi:phage recombination protein Bet
MEKKTQTAAVEKRSVLHSMADRYSVESGKLLETLKNTAFKGATNEQLMALCIVADQYKLNPFTKEIYAFPDKNGGIVPVVGIDGWLRIINEHPQFDGMNVECNPDECTVTIFRKDRTHATVLTEYMGEVRRDNSAPWKSHPMRMLRHKAIIQCARAAFGYGGIKDPDEAERIIEGERKPVAMPVAIQAEVMAEPTATEAQ